MRMGDLHGYFVRMVKVEIPRQNLIGSPQDDNRLIYP